MGLLDPAAREVVADAAMVALLCATQRQGSNAAGAEGHYFDQEGMDLILHPAAVSGGRQRPGAGAGGRPRAQPAGLARTLHAGPREPADPDAGAAAPHAHRVRRGRPVG